MRLHLAAVALMLLAGRAWAQESSALEVPVHGFKLPRRLPTCGLEAVLLKFAKETAVRIGFERTTDCNGRPASGFPTALKPLDLSDAEVLDGMGAKDVLARIAALVPDYDWAIMEGVAVFRPSAAWSDAKSPMRATVPATHASEAPLVRVMADILNRPDLKNGQGPLVSIDFRGGTLLEALNALVRSDLAMWYVGSDGETLRVSIMFRPDGRGIGMSTPVSVDFTRRLPSS